MKDDVRQELKELCYYIIENNNQISRPEQLTKVQMLYERLLVINYLEQLEEAKAEPIKPSQASKAAPTPLTQTEQPKAKPEAEANADKPAHAPQPEEASYGQPEEAEALKPKPKTQEEEKNVREDAKVAPSESAVTPRKAPAPEAKTDRNLSINDRLAGGKIEVGLNDRIAFVKHLFEGKQQDFVRVLGQLNTLDNYQESIALIENLVKPDYDWSDKEEYEERLLELIRKRFGVED